MTTYRYTIYSFISHCACTYICTCNLHVMFFSNIHVLIVSKRLVCISSIHDMYMYFIFTHMYITFTYIPLGPCLSMSNRRQLNSDRISRNSILSGNSSSSSLCSEYLTPSWCVATIGRRHLIGSTPAVSTSLQAKS